MSSLSLEKSGEILEQLRRVPSPHNTQPLLWKLGPYSGELWIDSSRILHVSDPNLRDLEMSCGAGIALLKGALQVEGFELSEFLDFPVQMQKEGHQKRLSFQYRDFQRGNNRYASFVQKHRCYRGKFMTLPEATPKFFSPNTLLITGSDEKRKISQWHDRALIRFLAQADYAEELNQWLRLSKRHPKYQEDGLNTEAMNLDSMSAVLSSFVLKPQNLKLLSRLGILKPWVSEATQNNSAEGYLVLVRDPNLSLFEQGEEMLRIWTELEAQGRVFCPVSSLIDDPALEKQLRMLAGAKQPIIHVLRYGFHPRPGSGPLTPRLSQKQISLGATPL